MSSVASNQAASNSDEVSSPKYHAKRDLKFTFIQSFGFLFLAVLNTFGTSGTSYEYLFRPQPTNIYYDFMFVAICLGVAISDWTLYFLGIGRSSSNTYLFLKLLLPFVIGVLYCVGGAWCSGVIWIVFSAIVAKTSELSAIPNFKFERPKSLYYWFYSILLCLFGIGFIAFPVFQDWSGPPQPFVRWNPYNLQLELVWRGIFATYAISMIWTALQDPQRNNYAFSVFLAISSFIHSSVMLIMNLVESKNGKSNGNLEHLYGDVAGWYFIALVAFLAVLLAEKKSNVQQPRV